VGVEAQTVADETYQAEQRLTEAYAALYPAEVAATLEVRPAEEVASFLAGRDPGVAAVLLDRLSPPQAAESLARMELPAAGRILLRLDPSRAAVLIANLPEPRRDELLGGVDEGLAREIREVMSYPPDTAGHFMDRRVLAFQLQATVEEVLARLRRLGRARTQHVVVIDQEGRLAGLIPLAEVVMAEPPDVLADLIKAPPPRVHVLAPRDEVVEVLTQTRVSTLPVVDLDDRLLGVIRHDALVQAVREAAAANIQAMVGVSRDERALSTPWTAVRKRLPWLNINLLTAFLAAAVVGIFEDTIARFTALAVLLPVVAGQSGNTGAQALAVTMRGLALREIRLRHWRRVLTKEVVAGLLNGSAIAVVTSLGVFLWSRSAGLTLVIFLAMVASMAIAGLAGGAIPLLLAAARQDPAQSGSIILTTVTDVAGFFSFLGLATLLASLL